MDNSVRVAYRQPVSIFTVMIGIISAVCSFIATLLYYAAFSVELVKATKGYPDVDEDWSTYTPLFSFYICLTLMAGIVFASVLLVIGAIKRRHVYMAPWLFICAISIVATAVFGIYITLTVYKSVNLFMPALWAIVLQVVVFIPISNVYVELRDGTQIPSRNRAASAQPP